MSTPVSAVVIAAALMEAERLWPGCTVERNQVGNIAVIDGDDPTLQLGYIDLHEGRLEQI
jgi:hypothetical protein